MAVKTNVSTAIKYPDGMRSGDLKKFNAIASATEQIITLTEDLLILARSANNRDLSSEEVNLTRLLQKIAVKYQPQITAKSLRLIMNIQSDLLVRRFINSFERLFINLIENAIYYTPSVVKLGF